MKKWQCVRVLAGIGHGQETGLGVLQLEVLVLELLAVDGLATGALSSTYQCLFPFQPLIV